MIKAFLFDYGGVMTDGGRGTEVTNRLADNLDISIESAGELINLGWRDYIKGKVDEAGFWGQLQAKHGPISAKQRDIWNSWQDMTMRPDMYELVQSLKTRGYQVGLLSNAFAVTAQEIRDNGGYDAFDFTVISCAVGLAKPDREIYELALKHFDSMSAEEVVFLDDQERCLLPAREMGMQTILVDNPEQAIRDVEALIS
jgi:epoxide hydrolase-like predicted phosphatase